MSGIIVSDSAAAAAAAAAAAVNHCSCGVGKVISRLRQR